MERNFCYITSKQVVGPKISMENFSIDYIGDGFCCDRSSSCASTYTKRLSLLHKRSVPYILPSVGLKDLSTNSTVFDSQTLMTEVIFHIFRIFRFDFTFFAEMFILFFLQKMLHDIVKSSSSMIAKLKRSGENSNRNDNFLLDQYFKRGLAYEKLNKIDRSIADFTACIDINRYVL